MESFIQVCVLLVICVIFSSKDGLKSTVFINTWGGIVEITTSAENSELSVKTVTVSLFSLTWIAFWCNINYSLQTDTILPSNDVFIILVPRCVVSLSRLISWCSAEGERCEWRVVAALASNFCWQYNVFPLLLPQLSYLPVDYYKPSSNHLKMLSAPSMPTPQRPPPYLK